MSNRITGRNQILLLKLTPGVRNEAGALARGRSIHSVARRTAPRRLRNRDVLVIQNARGPDTILLPGRRRPVNLATGDGRRQLTDALGLDGRRAKAVQTALRHASYDIRDELARLARVLSWAELGTAHIDRVVLSGHATIDGIRGNDYHEAHSNGELLFADLRGVVSAFPRAAAQIKHLMLSACYLGGDEALFGRLRRIFPNLVSLTGYTAKAPAGRSPAAHTELRRWSRATARGKAPRRTRVFGKCREPAPDESRRVLHRRQHGVVITARRTERCQ